MVEESFLLRVYKLPAARSQDCGRQRDEGRGGSHAYKLLVAAVRGRSHQLATRNPIQFIITSYDQDKVKEEVSLYVALWEHELFHKPYHTVRSYQLLSFWEHHANFILQSFLLSFIFLYYPLPCLHPTFFLVKIAATLFSTVSKVAVIGDSVEQLCSSGVSPALLASKRGLREHLPGQGQVSRAGN